MKKPTESAGFFTRKDFNEYEKESLHLLYYHINIIIDFRCNVIQLVAKFCKVLQLFAIVCIFSRPFAVLFHVFLNCIPFMLFNLTVFLPFCRCSVILFPSEQISLTSCVAVWLYRAVRTTLTGMKFVVCVFGIP